MKKSYMEKAATAPDGDGVEKKMGVILDGLQHYTEEILSVINGNRRMELPLIVVAMRKMIKSMEADLDPQESIMVEMLDNMTGTETISVLRPSEAEK